MYFCVISNLLILVEKATIVINLPAPFQGLCLVHGIVCRNVNTATTAIPAIVLLSPYLLLHLQIILPAELFQYLKSQ